MTVTVTPAELAIITAALGNAANGTVNINGNTYTWTGFTIIGNNLVIMLPNNATVTFDGGAPAPNTTTPGEICTGAVKVFRLSNGDLEVYSGFDAAPPNGFLVAIIPAGQLGGFSNNTFGWSASLGADGVIRVFDAGQNLVSDVCRP